MLKKVGAFSKDPSTDSCITICGVSKLDACADACTHTICVNQHQVAKWNDVCLRRCQNRFDKINYSYGIDGGKSQASLAINLSGMEYREFGSSNIQNENAPTGLVALDGCCTSEVAQLLDERGEYYCHWTQSLWRDQSSALYHRGQQPRHAWEKWRGQITKLDYNAFWVQCGHRQTREGLRKLDGLLHFNTLDGSYCCI